MRLLLVGSLAYAAAVYVLKTFVSVESHHAHINAEIMALRAPIEGRVSLNRRLRGTWPAGAVVFRVENPRIGTVLAQLNYVAEFAEGLVIASEEAALRYAQQEQVFRSHETMHAEGIISRLLFLEEKTRLELARTAMSNKLAQLDRAQARVREMEEQVNLQREAVVTMPFGGVAWSVAAQDGQVVGLHETVLEIVNPNRVWVDAIFHERQARRMSVGAPVTIRTLDGQRSWPGMIESVRAGVGRIPYGNVAVTSPLNFTRRQLAVRVRMETANPFDAGEFYGVGRSVVVSLDRTEPLSTRHGVLP